MQKSEISLDKELKKNLNLKHDIKTNNKNIKKLECKIEVLLKENKNLLTEHDDIKKLHSDHEIINKSNLRYKNEMNSIKEENKNLLSKIDELIIKIKNDKYNFDSIIFENDTNISNLTISNKKLTEEIEEKIKNDKNKFENYKKLEEENKRYVKLIQLILESSETLKKEHKDKLNEIRSEGLKTIKNIESNFESEKDLLYDLIEDNNKISNDKSNKKIGIHMKSNRLLRSNIRSTSSIEFRRNKNVFS